MKIFLILILLAFSQNSFSSPKDVNFGWGNKGLKVDFPKYKQKSRQFKSDYRYAENAPKRFTREGFISLDKSVNKKLKSLFK